MLVDIAYSGEPANTSILILQVNTADDLDTTAFDAFDAIPALTPPSRKFLNVPETADTQVISSSASTTQNAGSSVTLLNDERVVRYIIEQHDKLIEELSATLGPHNFSTILEFQPLHGYVGEVNARRGGNMLGLENSTSSKLICVLSALVEGENATTQLPRGLQRTAAAMQKIEDFSKSLGLWEEFFFMNYAQPNKNPLGSYGDANVEFMKRTAKKFDLEGFLQSRAPGGFKISRV